jgi:uncharacterized protein
LAVLSNVAISIRLVEMSLLFFAVPVVLTWFRGTIPPIPVLMGVTLVLSVWLWLDPSFDRRSAMSLNHLGSHLRSIFMLLIPSAILLGGILYWYRPEAVFRFPRERPALWMLVMCFYPLFSVLPQTIIYRAFFFHRYEPIGQQLQLPAWGFILVAGVAFAFGHIIFKNWVAIALTFGGGIIFAFRYYTTRSLLISAIEHALYGQLLFTLGYGLFLYHGRPTSS